MDEFDVIKNTWKQQTLPENLENLKPDNLGRFKKQQAKIIFSNLFTSVTFGLVFITLGWVWTSFPNRSLYFYGGLAFMYLLLIVMLIVLWMGVQYRNPDSSISSKKYITQCLKKLYHRRKTMTTYFYIYVILLFLGLSCYMFDFVEKSSWQSIALMYGSTSGYLLISGWLGRKRRKRKLEEIDVLIKELEMERDQIDH